MPGDGPNPTNEINEGMQFVACPRSFGKLPERIQHPAYQTACLPCLVSHHDRGVNWIRIVPERVQSLFPVEFLVVTDIREHVLSVE